MNLVCSCFPKFRSCIIKSFICALWILLSSYDFFLIWPRNFIVLYSFWPTHHLFSVFLLFEYHTWLLHLHLSFLSLYLLYSLKFMISLLFHIYKYIYTYTYMYIYIHILLSPFSMDLFWADHLGLDNLSVGSSLEKANSPSQPLITFSSQGVGPCEIYPIHVGRSASIVIVEVLFMQPYCWDFMGIDSMTYVEDTISQQRHKSSGFYSSSVLSSAVFPEFFCRGYIGDVPLILVFHGQLFPEF